MDVLKAAESPTVEQTQDIQSENKKTDLISVSVEDIELCDITIYIVVQYKTVYGRI